MVPAFWNDFDNLLSRDWPSLLDNPGFKSVPAVNVKESETGYHIEMAAPGMKKEDFRISLENGLLEISSEAKSEQNEKKENFTMKEFHYSSFKRSFTMPEQVDEGRISASYADGILKLDLPKKESAKPVAPKTISIS